MKKGILEVVAVSTLTLFLVDMPIVVTVGEGKQKLRIEMTRDKLVIEKTRRQRI